MRRPLLLALLVAAACAKAPPPPPPEAGRNARTVLQEIAAKYGAIRTYAADVEAEVAYHVGDGVDRRTVRGRLVAARPLRFRWEGDLPWRVVAVSDGETVVTYLPDVGTARVRPASEAAPRFARRPSGADPLPSLLVLPLLVRGDVLDVLTLGARTFRLGEGEGLETVEISWADDLASGTAAPEARTRYGRDGSGLVRLAEHEVSIAVGGGPPRLLGGAETAAATTAGRVRVVVRERHEGIRTNEDVPDTAFRLDLPPGTKVVEEFDAEALDVLRKR